MTGTVFALYVLATFDHAIARVGIHADLSDLSDSNADISISILDLPVVTIDPIRVVSDFALRDIYVSNREEKNTSISFAIVYIYQYDESDA